MEQKTAVVRTLIVTAFIALAANMVPTSRVQASQNCCIVIGIDRHRSVVTARDEISGHILRFVVPRLNLRSFKVGQIVSANYDDMKILEPNGCPRGACRIILHSGMRPAQTAPESL